MADDNNNDQELELNELSKKKKLVIIIGIVFVLISVVGGYVLFNSPNQALSKVDINAELSSGEAKVKTVPQKSSAIYVAFPRSFRFYAPGASRDRFVEINVQFLVRSKDNKKAIEKHIPLLESTLLEVFSQANADDLATSEGKATLKKKSLTVVQNVMTDIVGRPTVEQLLSTGFVMQ